MADNNDESKSPKPNTYYAGNGQAVEGEDDSRKTIDELFDKARELGGVPPEQFTSHRSANFNGVGRRLGHEPGPSLAVQPLKREERSVKVSFHRNGYTVDDSDLRDPQSAEGRLFLAALNRGLVPREVADKYPNMDITVALEDRSGEEHVRQFKAFEGSGQRLVAPAAPVRARDQDAFVAGEFEFRESEPSAKIVVQLPNGAREEIKVNPHRHTIADVRGIVASKARCATTDFDLILRAGLKPQLLDDPQATIADAKATNSLIIVKAR
jgi:UBX domain-containing protein 1